MRVTSVQIAMEDRSKEDAVRQVLGAVDRCPPSDLILLPEIWPSGFFCFDRYEPDSETMDGPVVTLFRERAARRGCHILMGSLVEREGDRIYNTSVLLDSKGEIIAKYRKIHLFGYRSREKAILTPGKDVVVAKTPWGIAGLSTCYDLRFPEFYRKMLDQGATLFLVASAWPKVRLDPWRLFNRVRALENLSYLFSCNCAGANAGIEYAGHSMLVDPWGNVVAEGGEGECHVTAEIDPSLVQRVRQEFSAVDDRVFR